MTVLVCLAWISPAGYAAHRAADPTLQPRFEQWRKNAQALHQQMEREGRVVRRVMVDFEELAAWCRREGRTINARARAEFAAWKGTVD